MVATTEDNTNRQEVLKLIEEKESIEQKINEFGEILRKVSSNYFTTKTIKLKFIILE